jgi:hypothetical protein
MTQPLSRNNFASTDQIFEIIADYGAPSILGLLPPAQLTDCLKKNPPLLQRTIQVLSSIEYSKPDLQGEFQAVLGQLSTANWREILSTERTKTLTDRDLGLALKCACKSGNSTFTETLWEDPHLCQRISDGDLGEAFTLAALNGHHELVRQFLAHDALFSRISLENRDLALVCASREGKSAVVRQFLSHEKYLANLSSLSIASALIQAAKRGDVEMVTLLLTTNICPEKLNEALVEAVEKGHSKVVRAFFQAQSKSLSDETLALILRRSIDTSNDQMAIDCLSTGPIVTRISDWQLGEALEKATLRNQEKVIETFCRTRVIDRVSNKALGEATRVSRHNESICAQLQAVAQKRHSCIFQ